MGGLYHVTARSRDISGGVTGPSRGFYADPRPLLLMTRLAMLSASAGAVSRLPVLRGLLSRPPGPGCPLRRSLSYQQGQSPEPRTREYFYYIDHQGQLFLDDTKVKNFITCFKDKPFLVFFFKHLRRNETGRYQDDFPYVSLCGRERNFICCEDRPIVFTHLLPEEHGGRTLLSYCGGGDKLTVTFEAEKLVMFPENGRVYHPAPAQCGGVGLVKSSLAFELSAYFEYGSGSKDSRPTHFLWAGQRYALTNELIRLLV